MDQPPQDPEERRQIRRKYRELDDQIQDKREELLVPGSTELSDMLIETDALFQRVKNPREAALDSKVMTHIANLGRQKAQALHTEFVRFQPTEFAEKLVTFLGGAAQVDDARISAKGWEKLGEAVQPLFKRTPSFQFMAGSFARESRKDKEPRRARAPKERDNVVGKETIPQQLDSFGDKEKSEATTEEVERVYHILQEKYEEMERRPLCYFEFVLNPYSFGHTVENIFYASFLVRDNLADISLDDDLLPVIVPLVEKEGDAKKENVKRCQTVLSITPQEWQELVREFKIEEPTIPSKTDNRAANRPSSSAER